MVANAIPDWIIELDDRKPYIEVLHDRKLPAVSPRMVHGLVAVRLSVVLESWARSRGYVGAEVRFYFEQQDGTWSSLLPDTAFMSFARFPEAEVLDDSFLPVVAPDIAVEVVSPGDRSSRTLRKVETYLEFGSSLVIVVDPTRARVKLYRPDGVEEREARGAWAPAPYEDLVIDWDDVLRNVTVKRRGH
jgi:Uma2 family endonuclease